MSDSIPFKNYALAAFFVSIATILVGLIAQKILPPVIPLFYGLATGEEQLAPSWALILPPLVSLIILGLNILVTNFIEDDFLKKTLIVTALFATFFSTITTVKIIFLVGNF